MRLLRWYGAGPLHLLALLASFSLTGYAAQRLLGERPLAVAVWFAAGAVGHDLVLLPLYSLADWSLARLARRERPPAAGAALVNYVRFPAAISALLFVVWFPSILRLSPVYAPTTGLSSSPYLARWLAVSAGLFVVSAVCAALRLRRGRPPAAR